MQTSPRKLWADPGWRSQHPSTAQRNSSTAQEPSVPLHSQLGTPSPCTGKLSRGWLCVAQRAQFTPLMCTNSPGINQAMVHTSAPLSSDLSLNTPEVMAAPTSSCLIHSKYPNQASHYITFVTPDWWQNNRSKSWLFSFSAVLVVCFYLEVLFICCKYVEACKKYVLWLHYSEK